MNPSLHLPSAVFFLYLEPSLGSDVGCRSRLGKTLMAIAIWPLDNGQETVNRKHPDRFCIFSPVFACFRPFLPFCAFSLVFALFGPCVSDRFWPSVFALFRTIRLLPFSGCHSDSLDRLRLSNRSLFMLDVSFSVFREALMSKLGREKRDTDSGHQVFLMQGLH